MINQRKTLERANRTFLKELPYYDCKNIVAAHPLYNSNLPISCHTRNQLDKFKSLFDLDLFNLNVPIDNHTNLNENFNSSFRCRYFTPHNFALKANALPHSNNSYFSVLHNNIRSLSKNLDDFQSQLLHELNTNFSIIGVTETRIVKNKPLNFNPTIPGYNFEYVPTPLSAGGVGLYIKESFSYRILENTSNASFQALWCEIEMDKQKNVICGVVYRQHKNPESFLEYLANTLENLSLQNKNIVLVGDFNIDLLKIESCSYSQKLFQSLQSLTVLPAIDKPTRSHGRSATLIDNIFLNNFDNLVLGGNVVSDVSDHFAQVCVLSSPKNCTPDTKTPRRDFSYFNPDQFNHELKHLNWSTSSDPDCCFNNFYNKLNKLTNKHAPFKKLSKRKCRQFAKPWITKGLLTSIRKKNKLYLTGQ